MSDITRKYFTHNSNYYQVTSFRGGRMEVYLVKGDGLEMFQGYIDEVNIDLANAAYDAFQTATGQRWLFDAGSESILMLSDGRWAH